MIKALLKLWRVNQWGAGHSVVNQYISYECAKLVSREKHDENKGKNDLRVNYAVQNDYYWGGNMHGASLD